MHALIAEFHQRMATPLESVWKCVCQQPFSIADFLCCVEDNLLRRFHPETVTLTLEKLDRRECQSLLTHIADCYLLTGNEALATDLYAAANYRPPDPRSELLRGKRMSGGLLDALRDAYPEPTNEHLGHQLVRYATLMFLARNPDECALALKAAASLLQE